jgi:hypothetical protein
MGEYESGKTIVWLSVYFVALIFALSVLQAGFTAMDLEYSFVTSDDETLLESLTVTGERCVDPRYYTTDDGTREEINTYNENTAECQWTDGRISESSCEKIAGCTWNDATTTFFFFTRDASCDGIVNLTNYSSFTTQETNYFKLPSSVHDPDTIYIVGGNTPQFQSKLGDYVTQDICELGESKQACAVLGCTWTDISDSESDFSIGTILAITGGLFTFDVTFTDEAWTNLLLTLLLFYIPLLWYIVSIYFALPFLH